MSLGKAETEEADDILVSLLFGDAKEKELARDRLEDWIGGNAERRAYIDDLKKVDRAVDEQSQVLQRKYERHVRTVDAPARVLRRPFSAKWLAIGGVTSACCAAAIALIVNPVLSTTVLSSSTGQQQSFVLSDGTKVTLNNRASAQFVNHLRSREVVLGEGEAMFAVVHSEVRPFVVLASGATIRDIGTEFTVRKSPAVLSVAVIQGIVNIDGCTGQSMALRANEGANLEAGQLSAMSSGQQFANMVSWKDQRLVMSGEPLSGLIEELQQYRKAPILLGDAKAGTYKVTGSFSSKDPDALLRALPDVAPVTVTFRHDGAVVLASRKRG